MRRYIVPAIIAGVIGAVVGPVLVPSASRVLRPVTKFGIKAGLFAVRGTRARLAELSETLDDLTHEVKDEMTPKA